jgi:GGDEF domain-containing protein
MAADENAGFTVAIVQIEGLEELNRQEGYLAGDQAILTAARSAQRAALRFGGTVYRDSGRRFGILVTAGSRPAQPDLIAELHTEFAIGPPFRVGLATWRPGETVEVVVHRARAALSAEVLPPSEPMGQ